MSLEPMEPRKGISRDRGVGTTNVRAIVDVKKWSG